jgi:glutathione S-transferase
MSPIKIFGFAGSTYVQTARWACIEKGVEHELLPLAFRTESHAERHPFLKMPAMEHEGVRLFETLAIVAYVDGLSSKLPLVPSSAEDRARALQWVSASIDYLYRDLVGALLSETVPDAHAKLIERDLDLLEEALRAHEQLAGAQLSVADLFVAPMVNFALAKEAKGTQAKREHLMRWLTGLRARSGFASTQS